MVLAVRCGYIRLAGDGEFRPAGYARLRREAGAGRARAETHGGVEALPRIAQWLRREERGAVGGVNGAEDQSTAGAGRGPRDSELLERLAQARACGDDGECRALSGGLIAAGCRRWSANACFRRLSRQQLDDAVGRWGERIVKRSRSRRRSTFRSARSSCGTPPGMPGRARAGARRAGAARAVTPGGMGAEPFPGLRPRRGRPERS